MDHLYQNYGVITTVNIKDNDIRMREPYVQSNLSDGYILSSDRNSGGRICHCRQAAISKNRPSRFLVAFTSLSYKLDYTQEAFRRDWDNKGS